MSHKEELLKKNEELKKQIEKNTEELQRKQNEKNHEFYQQIRDNNGRIRQLESEAALAETNKWNDWFSSRNFAFNEGDYNPMWVGGSFNFWFRKSALTWQCWISIDEFEECIGEGKTPIEALKNLDKELSEYKERILNPFMEILQKTAEMIKGVDNE